MKITILLSFLLLCSCSLTSVKTYFKSDSFIDIEFGRNDFGMICSILDEKKKKSLMTFYGVSGDTIYEFFFRSISEDGLCEKLALREYRKLVENTPRVRIVGIMPLDKQGNGLVGDSVSEKFRTPQYLQNWTFVRLQTSEGCKAYFDKDCGPESYWAGLLPQK